MKLCLKSLLIAICAMVVVAPVCADLGDGYVQIVPDDTTTYPETLTGYTSDMMVNGYFNLGLAGSNGNPGYIRRSLDTNNITVSGTKVYTAFVRGSPTTTNSVNGIGVTYLSSSSATFIRLRYIGTDMWGNEVSITNKDTANAYFSEHPTPVLYKITTATNNVHVAAKRLSDGVIGYYCTSGDCVASNNNASVKFIPVYGMTGTANPCPGGTLVTYTSATGTVSQSGTPSPTNPITPTFYTQGNMVLRRVGDYADSYDATTGKITRRVGVKVLDGTEAWFYKVDAPVGGDYLGNMYNLVINDIFTETMSVTTNRQSPYCTHFARSTSWISNSAENRLNKIQAYTPSAGTPILGLGYSSSSVSTANIPTFKSWLAAQYANGTPVIVYYPLKTAVVEDWAAEQCESGNLIKIATTKYNEHAFESLVTTLNQAITKVTNIVNDTVSQASSIGTLATTKQDRPADGDCPAGRKCLLVTGTDGKPHWYLIEECGGNAFMETLYNGLSSGAIEINGAGGSKNSSGSFYACSDSAYSSYCVIDSANPGAWVLPIKTTNSDYTSLYNGAIVYGQSRCVNDGAVFNDVANESSCGSNYDCEKAVTLSNSEAANSASGTVCIHRVTGYKSANGSNTSLETSTWVATKYSSASDCVGRCHSQEWPEGHFHNNFTIFGSLGNSCR